MLTIFTTAKAFVGHSAVIQRNALASWRRLHPRVEVILFGDDQAAAGVCAEFGLRHEPHVERNESGLKFIDYDFDRAQEIACHDTLCYANCDIIFLPDLLRAIQTVQTARLRFLVAGRRWDTDVRESIDFADAAWADRVRRLAVAANQQRDGHSPES